MQARQLRLSDSARSEKLDYEIAEWSVKGYRVVFRTATTAQLVKPKHFSGFWATIWFCVAVIGLGLYVIYHLSKTEHVVYLLVDDEGKIHQDG